MYLLKTFWISYALVRMPDAPGITVVTSLLYFIYNFYTVLCLGLNAEMRTQDSASCVTIEEAQEFTDECGFEEYLEISAKQDENCVEAVFEAVVELYFKYGGHSTSGKRCCVQ